MSDVVNLNRARKKKRAEEAEKDAAASRAKFGRTKATKLKDKTERERVARLLDGHRKEE